PLNITVNCTEASHCEIQWKKPRTSHVKNDHCFKYELLIEDKVRIIMTLNSILYALNFYTFDSFSAEKRYSVKIRATDNGCLVSSSWGEWSTPVEFGKTQLTSTSSYTLFLIPVLAASLVLFLCMVRIYLKRTSATVPQPKDPFHELSTTDVQVCFLSICPEFVINKDPLQSQKYDLCQ
ncbi:CSF2R factor, partial [Ardeotis kori]|nr:CSF2R factor [Ardeotis kori]